MNLDEAALAIQAMQDRIKDRSNLPYDGILGGLPEWVPDPVQSRFKEVRNRMIDILHYSPKQAVEWLDRFVSMKTDNDRWFYPATYPNGIDLDPHYFLDTIGYLAHLRWTSTLNPERGIYMLSGEYARQGYMRMVSGKNLRSRYVTALTLLIKDTFNRLKKHKGENPTWKEVILSLENYDSPTYPTIEEIDWTVEKIYWNDSKGNLKNTGFSQFRNKLTDLRCLNSGY